MPSFGVPVISSTCILFCICSVLFQTIFYNSPYESYIQCLLTHIKRVHAVAYGDPLTRRCRQTAHIALFDFSAGTGLFLTHFEL